MNRARAIAAGIVALLFCTVLLLVLLIALSPVKHEGTDSKTGISFEYVHDGDEAEGRSHLIALRVRGGDRGAKRVKALFRRADESSWGSVDLTPMPGNGLHVGELPGAVRGERILFYFVVQGPGGGETLSGELTSEAGNSFTVPVGAFERDRHFELRYKGPVSPVLAPLHAGLFAVAPLFLLHGFFLVLLFLLREAREKGGDRLQLHGAYLDALIFFILIFIGAIPLGMVVNQSVFGTFFEGWPFGLDPASTATEIILLIWLAPLVWRMDLLRRRGDPKPKADNMFAYAFAASLVLSGATLLMSVPHVFGT
jgi:hypothetical protein